MTSRRALIVDDDKDHAEVLGDLLELHGYAVTTVHSGDDALSELRDRPFDVALLDMRMPGKCGVPLLREMLGLAPRLAVIVVTGYVDPDSSAAAMLAGAREVMIKPVESDLLMAAIERLEHR